MVRKIIILGELNKKHLLLLGFALCQIAHKMYNRYFFPDIRSNTAFDYYVTSFGMMSCVFLPCIMKIKYDETEKEKQIHKKKFLHFSLLGVVFILYIIMKLAPVFMKGIYAANQRKSINSFSESAFLIMGVEMIVLAILSFFMLKYKYYKHHIISMALFIVCGISCDLFLDAYEEMKQFTFLINFIEYLSILTDSVNYYYQKYLMEKLYYPYWRVSLCLGITYFLFATGFLIYFLSGKSEDGGLFQLFYSYFTNKDVGIKIAKLLIVYVSITINGTLNILIIYYFNPNYILISFQISKIVQVLIDEEKEKYYCIFFFVLQFLALMIYLEIIELNFCGLNDNTKSKIEYRGQQDFDGDFGRTSSVDNIDINKDYFIDTKDVNTFEMKAKTGSENDYK